MPWLLPAGAMAAGVLGLLGLMVGSFLNVVIHRLPRILEARWKAECAQWHAETSTEGASSASRAPAPEPGYSLSRPGSHCPHCQHPIRWYQNIPLLSYVALRGRCAHCQASIGLRYPLVELATAVLFAYCGSRWGISPSGLAWSFFCAVLVSAALIDWDTTLLPDDLTLPLVWGGLVASVLGWSGVQLEASLWGAVAGYLSLWSVYWGFKLLTGKEGMGYGDFKLLAALGAWFGWQALIAIILMASVIGAIVGIGMKVASTLREGRYVPFGPFLAGAGLTAMLVGPARMLAAVGL